MKWDALRGRAMLGGADDRRDRRPLDILILRECFLRTRRFEGFQSALGITRHLLAERLKKLVRTGILRRIPYQESPKRHEYILTQKGLDLYPIMMAIVHWGDTHMVDERGRPLLHEHKQMRQGLRSGDGVLRMRRAADGQGSHDASRSRRASGRRQAHHGTKRQGRIARRRGLTSTRCQSLGAASCTSPNRSQCVPVQRCRPIWV